MRKVRPVVYVCLALLLHLAGGCLSGVDAFQSLTGESDNALRPSPFAAVQGLAADMDDGDGPAFPWRSGEETPPASEMALRELLTARSAMVMESGSGVILYAHEADQIGQPASTIKILTGFLALKMLDRRQMVTVSDRAAQMPPSKVYLQAGERYAAGNLVPAVLLASANDASVALAEEIAGSERLFATLMTYQARKMGATHTICRNATGLTAEGQGATVRDLARLLDRAMEYPPFAWVMGAAKVTTDGGMEFSNHNKALWRVLGAAGGKTGYTRAAGQTYVGKFCRGEDELVVALMGSEQMWRDLRYLVAYGFFEKQRRGGEAAARQNMLAGRGGTDVHPGPPLD